MNFTVTNINHVLAWKCFENFDPDTYKRGNHLPHIFIIEHKQLGKPSIFK